MDEGSRSCEKRGLLAMHPRAGMWWASLAIVVLAAVAVASAADSPRGDAAVFEAHCAQCHGETGETDTPSARALKVRPLVGDAELARMELADLVKAIRTNPKHQGVGALKGVGDAELEASARFVKELARKQ